MKLLSVIVPVYQCEKYLERCVRGILDQPLEDLELILVDDGSTDGSGALCAQLAAEDGRVIVVRQPNGGVSAARNAGLDLASGKFIQFVDGDDWLEDGYSQSLVETAERTEADLVIAGYTTVHGEERRIHPAAKLDLRTAEDVARNFATLYFAMLLNSPCNKLYRRERLVARFPLGVRMGEDLMFNMEYLMTAERVVQLQANGYFYRQSEGGASARTRFQGDGPAEMLAYCRCVLPFLKQYLAREKWESVYDAIVFHSLCNNLNTVARRGGSRAEMRAYLRDPDISASVGRVRLAPFPWNKQAVGLCLKLGLEPLALKGVQMAAGR